MCTGWLAVGGWLLAVGTWVLALVYWCGFSLGFDWWFICCVLGSPACIRRGLWQRGMHGARVAMFNV